MSQIHYFICDICEHHVAVPQEYGGMGTQMFRRPKEWITIEQYEVCSQECANKAVSKLKNLPAETAHCKCRGCR